MLEDLLETIPNFIVAAPFREFAAAESVHAFGVHGFATNACREVGRWVYTSRKGFCFKEMMKRSLDWRLGLWLRGRKTSG